MRSTKRLTTSSIVRGVAAGAVGTVAMDVLWYARYRRGGGDEGFLDWEFSRSTKSFDDAGAPAQVGRRIAKTLFRTELPAEAAAATNNVVHWSTGVQWGAIYGIALGSLDTTSPAFGLALGPLAWGTSYALLGVAKVYKPIWEYDTKTLGKDLSAHLVFGVATAAAFRALTSRR
jgi:hypothetical protein